MNDLAQPASKPGARTQPADATGHGLRRQAVGRPGGDLLAGAAVPMVAALISAALILMARGRMLADSSGRLNASSGPSAP